MEFFGNGKKAPPKGAPTGLFIDPEELKSSGGQEQGRAPGFNKNAADIEDVPVKPARRQPTKGNTLDLGGILGEADADTPPPKKQRPPKPAKAQDNVLDLDGVQEATAAQPAPQPEPEPEPAVDHHAAGQNHVAETSALDLQAETADVADATPVEKLVAEEVHTPTPRVEKLVAEEVEESVAFTQRRQPEQLHTTDNDEPPAPEAEAPGLRMHFKSKASTNSGQEGEGQPAASAEQQAKTGFFGGAKAGNPFAGFKSKKKGDNASESSDEQASKALKPKKASKGLGSLFSRKKASGAEAPTAEASTSSTATPSGDAKAKKGFGGFGGFSKKKGPQEPQQPKGKKSGPKRVTEQYIAVSLTVGSEMFWKVTETGIEQVEELQGRNAGPIASFTKDDVRIYVDTPQSSKMAAELSLQALEEKPRFINLSKTGNAIFTTPAQRLGAYKVRVGPGLPLLETLLAPHFEKNKDSLKDVISGFLLLNVETKELLVILYHFDINGNISPPEVTANPTDVHMTLRQFANSRKVDPAAADILLFRNEELLSAGVPKHLYPSDADFLGVPVTTVLSAGAVIATAAAIGFGAFAAQEYVTGVQLAKQSARVKQETDTHSRKVHELLSTSVASFAKHQTLAVDDLVKQAQSFWIPRSKVTMTATLNSQTYVVTLPMAQVSSSGEPASLLDAVSTEQVLALANMEVPENCSKQSPSVTGTLDVIQLTINCETAPGPFNRYRAD